MHHYRWCMECTLRYSKLPKDGTKCLVMAAGALNRAYRVGSQNGQAYPILYKFCRADERSVIRRMSDPHTADNAALIRPTVGVILGNNRISTQWAIRDKSNTEGAVKRMSVVFPWGQLL